MHGLIGDAVAWGALTGALGALLWIHEHHFQRFTAWLFAASAGFFAIGIPPWHAALAGLTTTGAGLTALGVLGLLIFPTFHLEAIRTHKRSRFTGLLGGKKAKGSGGPGGQVAILGSSAPRKNRHHRIRTPVVAMIAGTLAVVVIGGWRLLAKAAGRSAAGAGHALIQSSQQINSGKAAAAVPASHRPGIYVIAAIVLLVIIAVMRSVEKRKKGGGRRGGPQALPGGRGTG
jgi:hypothetical protein